MDNVEKKVAENFAKWREENNKKDNNEEAIEKDIKEYMHTAFQIKREAIKSESVNILDILDTMIAPNVEASVAVNAVRENVFACKKTNEQLEPGAGGTGVAGAGAGTDGTGPVGGAAGTGAGAAGVGLGTTGAAENVTAGAGAAGAYGTEAGAGAAGRRKRQDACTCSCSGQGFHLSGANCFWASSEEKLLITQ